MGYDDTFEHDGFRFGVSYETDTDNNAPWENEDGHGPVSDWRDYSARYGYAPKGPGERPLYTDKGCARFYDMRQAQLIARKDGWGYGGKSVAEWRATGLTLKQIAANAAQADFDRLRQWCDGQWYYVGVVVTMIDDDNEPVGDSSSVWGVESDGDYKMEVAKEIASELVHALRRAGGVAS